MSPRIVSAALLFTGLATASYFGPDSIYYRDLRDSLPSCVVTNAHTTDSVQPARLKVEANPIADVFTRLGIGVAGIGVGVFLGDAFYRRRKNSGFGPPAPQIV